MEFRTDADGRPVVSPSTQQRATRLVDEDRVDLAPNGSPSLAYRARVRSTSGVSYDVYFDDQGGVCTCEAARYGHVCAHLVAAMIAFVEQRDREHTRRRLTPGAAAFDQYQQARASRMTGHNTRTCPVCGVPNGQHLIGCQNQMEVYDR